MPGVPIELRVYRKVMSNGRVVERKVIGAEFRIDRVYFFRSDRIDDRPFTATFRNFRRWAKECL